MSALFREYELLSASGLFDAEHYRQRNPDVAGDPLLHYLERGADEQRDPSQAFDTAYYLQQCLEHGEWPANSLLHYLTQGRTRGLLPHPDGRVVAQEISPRTRTTAEELRAATSEHPWLYLDVPHIENGTTASSASGYVAMAGWAYAPTGIEAVTVQILSNHRITTARHGLRRPDVAAAHPNRPGIADSGFSAHVDLDGLTEGPHQIRVRAQDGQGHIATLTFTLQVRHGDSIVPPLRRRVSHAELGQKLDALRRLQVRPRFSILMAIDAHDLRTIPALLADLRAQAYPEWHLYLAPRGRRSAGSARTLLDRVKRVCADVAARVQRIDALALDDQGTRHFILRLHPRDRLGCDALLELALASAYAPQAELLYADDLRKSLGQHSRPFFKPAWSPALLLSMNYLGRAWCVDDRLLSRMDLAPAELVGLNDHDATLRLTEAATHIEHVPRLLMDSSAASPAASPRYVRLALERRGIDARVDAADSDRVNIAYTAAPSRVSLIVDAGIDAGMEEVLDETLQRLATRHPQLDIEIVRIAPDEGPVHAAAPVPEAIALRFQSADPWRQRNAAAQRSTGDCLLFLSALARPVDEEWLTALLAQAQCPKVGAAGPLLLYPDRSIHQAGLFLGEDGELHAAFQHLPAKESGCFGLPHARREVFAVSGACLVTRRDIFMALGGFRAHAIGSDVDYCMRLHAQGLTVMFTPAARLIFPRADSPLQLPVLTAPAPRLLAHRDPCFNSQTSIERSDFSADPEPIEIVYPSAGFDKHSVRRVAVLKLDHLGDCIAALPAVMRLREVLAHAHFTVIANTATRVVWMQADVVDEFIGFDFFHARSSRGRQVVAPHELTALENDLRSRDFDLAIDLRKQPDTRELLRLTQARILAGYDHQGRFPWLDVAIEWDEDVPQRAKHAHVSLDLLALVEAVAIQGTPRHEATLRLPARRRRLAWLPAAHRRLLTKPLLCLHPAAGNALRHWPLPHFATLIRLLLADWDIHVALIGSPAEAASGRELCTLLNDHPSVFDLLSHVPLPRLPELLAHTVLFVGNNSGPQHLAAAFGLPTLCIHGGVVDVNEWGPGGPSAMAIRRRMRCSPCYIERVADCPRELSCLTRLHPTSVARVCAQQLAIHAGQARRQRIDAEEHGC